MLPCEACKGTGKFSAFVDGFKDGKAWGEYREGLTCETCKGQGKITQAYFDRIEAGKELRRKRIEKGEKANGKINNGNNDG